MRVICRKLQIFPTTRVFVTPVGGYSVGMSSRPLASLSCCAVIVCRMTRLAVLIENRLVTDRRTHDHSTYRASIASRGKNCEVGNIGLCMGDVLKFDSIDYSNNN